MADEASEETQLTFNIKAANDQKHVVTVPSSMTVADLKAKLSTPEYVDLPPERQRLIYSGRVLKDHDTLEAVKIKDGHTIHLVKGAASNARQNPNQSSSTGATGTVPTPQVPTNIAAGTGNDVLSNLTGARYAGFHGLPSADMFGADGGMGPPPNPDQILQLMENPNFLQQMRETMDNPAVLELMQNNPMVRNNPMMAELLRNPESRRAMFNPEMMRAQLQMQRAMGGNLGGGSSFPMPGVTNTTPQDSANPQNPSNQHAASQDFVASILGGNIGAAGANPFASIFNPPPTTNPSATTTTNTGTNTTSTDTARSATPADTTQDTAPPANPFAGLFGNPTGGAASEQSNPMADAMRNLMQNPEAMRAAMQAFSSMQGAGAGASPFGAFGQPPSTTGAADPTGGANPFAALFGPGGGFGGPPPPQDNRPPEQVYEAQLRQLNEMGFYEFDRNVAALRRSGGNVQGAIEHLLNGGP